MRYSWGTHGVVMRYSWIGVAGTGALLRAELMRKLMQMQDERYKDQNDQWLEFQALVNQVPSAPVAQGASGACEY
jgi:hypothetical protein